MTEALVNHWTLDHFLFGIGTSAIIYFLLRFKYRVYTVSFAIILLWEAFEFRASSSYWIRNYGNNLVDIVVGIVGVFLGNKILDTLLRGRK
jgi:hypothetical protein